MNFMKILLIYMAATLSLAVQNTSAPVETPVPTPAPTAEVQTRTGETVPAGIVEAVTPTPVPTATPAPVPQITPNKKYHNLAKGDKGADVRALQERLIELGYLPAGAADGAYGNQTVKAVRNFQAYNGLTRDGIAGRATQTYLFENPDVNPYPTPTPSPSPTPEPTDTPEPTATPEPETPTPDPIPEETPTAEPAETPAETPTEEPAETPSEAPTEAPTETPSATPAEVPTEEPTAVPTEAPTEQPTETPTAAPTAEPTAEPTPERTASAPVTSAPSTEAPQPEPTMSVEELDPLELIFTETEGSVAYNETGAPLSWKALEDGVPVTHTPRLQKRGKMIRISLDDLASCLDNWLLTDDDATVVLEAEGHTLALLNEDAGIVATLDGTEIAVTRDDFDFGAGHFISAEFLAKNLGGSAQWAEDEKTLILRIPAGK